MAGIVFFRTDQRERVTGFYRNRLGAQTWLEQPAGCTILRVDNLLFGLCDGEQTETAGILTVVVPDEETVDRRYDALADVARGPPETSEAFEIYRFFADDPDGRTVEVQTFLHPTPPIETT